MIDVTNAKELFSALANQEKDIVITRNMTLAQPVLLPSGVHLRGKAQENGTLPSLFFSHTNGLILSGASKLTDLQIISLQNQKAISISPQTDQDDMGEIHLENLQTDGQVSLIYRSGVKKAKVFAKNIHINSSDTRSYLEQPQKYGVNVLQGAFTLYNFNPDRDSLVTAELHNLSIGSPNHPAIGSGIFISGFGDHGGQVDVNYLSTGNIYSSGLLPQGVATLITGGMFIVFGTHVKKLVQHGETVTYGVNDMVLDTWGTVDEWIVENETTSYGQSGVGFVNFGHVKHFKAQKPISTYGVGARAYNQYDGSLEKGEFTDLTTYNDGAVAIQISKKVGSLTISGNIRTYGGLGQSLVKGVNVDLPAYAFSLKEGGALQSLKVSGNIETYGDDVATITMEEGSELNQIAIKGEILSHSQQAQTFDSDKTKVLFKKS